MPGWTTYDEIPYSNHPYLQTHPERQAVVAMLRGLRPARPRRARVLELGCGAGGNLLGIAYAAPELKAVGVDLAGTAVEQARAIAAEVGIENAEFRQGDVRDLTDGPFGEFDYVICHGLYAWVPDDARDAILAACRSHLAPNGIAFVSYNAHPGGHLRALLREGALWFAGDTPAGIPRAERARELFRLMRARIDTDPYGAMLEMEIPTLVDGPLDRLVHDELSDNWEPVWFAHFAAAAARHDLAYVGESSPLDLWPPSYPEEVGTWIYELADHDRIRVEQLTDLLLFRRFRMTLLCRAEHAVSEALDRDAVRLLRYAVDPSDEEKEPGPVGELVDALRPRGAEGMTFDELLSGREANSLTDTLLEGMRQAAIQPLVDPPPYVVVAGEYPKASALARWQIARGEFGTSLQLRPIRIVDPPATALIGLLDGTRNRDAIRADLVTAGGPSLHPEQIEVNLRQLGDLGLLVQ